MQVSTGFSLMSEEVRSYLHYCDFWMVCCEEAAKVEDVEDDEEELEGWRSGDDGEWDKELDDEDDEVDDEADNQKLQKLAAHVWIFICLQLLLWLFCLMWIS